MHRLYSTSSNWNTQHLGGSSSWIFKCWQLVYCHHTIIIKLWNMYINLFNTSLKAYHVINFWLSTSSEISVHISLTQMQLKLILIFLEYFDVIVLLLTWQLWGLGRWCVGFPRGCCQLIRSTETRSTTYEPAKHFVNSAIDQNVITLQQKTRFSVQICQKLAQTHFLFHEYTVKYALTRISGSHVVTCGYSYKMPLICHGLIWFKTMIYISLLPKIISVQFQSPTMASDAKR